MIAFELPAEDVDAVLRVVRALGSHRYVVGRLHMVHAFAFASAGAHAREDGAAALLEADAWARGVLADPSIDIDSRDERLYRASSETEVAAVLEAFWRPGHAADVARDALRGWLAKAALPESDAAPFDERVEEDIHPLLVDAGWELSPLKTLDPTRHRGAIEWFGEPIDFEVACFEEENAVPPRRYLQELSGFGPAELLRGADALGFLDAPLAVWTEGNARYHEYVLAGVQRAAKL